MNSKSQKKSIIQKKWINTQSVIVFILVLLLGYLVFSEGEQSSEENLNKNISKEKKEKTVEILTFGEWEPQSIRSVLATVESPADITVVSETNGTIESVFVEMGDLVRKGQTLAQIKNDNNNAFIAYQNAVNNAEVIKISTQNSIRSAEISLEAAQKDLLQARQTEQQNQSQNQKTLATSAVNSESTLFNTLNWADEILGATQRFRTKQTPAKRYVGNNDAIMQQKTKVMVQKTFAAYENLEKSHNEKNLGEILSRAEERLTLLEETRKIAMNINDMIRRTNISRNFSESDRSVLQAEAERNIQTINGEIAGLNQKIENAKGLVNRTNTSLLSAQNRVENAKAALELAKANAKNQIQNAENQIKSSRANEVNLTIKSPITGRITEKMINAFKQVSMGQPLFSVVAQETNPKIVGFLSEDELEKLLLQKNTKIKLSNNRIYEVSQSFLSYKINNQTQKIQVEFEINKEEFPEEVLIGSFAEILIPIQSNEKNLIPITAVSFEPSGAEILRVNPNNKTAERQTVMYDKIIGDTIRITDGIQKGALFVRYKNRVNVGDRVQSPQEKKQTKPLNDQANS